MTVSLSVVSSYRGTNPSRRHSWRAKLYPPQHPKIAPMTSMNPGSLNTMAGEKINRAIATPQQARPAPVFIKSASRTRHFFAIPNFTIRSCPWLLSAS